MRIIGGEWRGRRLYAPEGMETRPTSDRVREALFNILQGRLAGARVLDLYAGSGALSLEALSRGAESAALADPSRKAVQAIRRNAELCGAQERIQVWATTWQQALPQLAGRRFTLVFLDPPYRQREAYSEAARRLREENLLEEDALLVLEHARGAEIESLPEEFEIFDTRRYGDTCLSLARERGV